MFLKIVNRLPALFFILVFGTYGYLAGDIQLDYWSEQETFNARSMPYIVSAGGVLVSTLLFLFPGPAVAGPPPAEQPGWIPAIALLVLMSLYGFTLEYLGFPLATSLFLVVGFIILGERRPLQLFLAAVPLVIGFWLLMDAMDIFLAPGDLLRFVTDD